MVGIDVEEGRVEAEEEEERLLNDELPSTMAEFKSLSCFIWTKKRACVVFADFLHSTLALFP